MIDLSGSCACEKIKFSIKAPLKFVVHDHCTICRKFAGSPFVTWAGIKEEFFKIEVGENLLSSYKPNPTSTRQFCSHCGTQLFFRGSRWPGEVHFNFLLVPQDSGQKPTGHVFYSDRLAWVDELSTLPKFGGPSGMEPLK